MATLVTPPISPGHSEDQLADRIAAAMTAKAAPVVEVSPVTIPQVVPPVTPTPEPTVVVVPPADEPIAAEIDLENIDFDKPETTPEVAPELGAAQHDAETEAKAVAELKEALSTGDLELIEKAELRTQRGRDKLAIFKTFRQCREAPGIDENGKPTGGIGRIPSFEEIRVMDSDHRDMAAMKFEALNNPASFVSNLFVPDAETGRSPFLGETAQIQQVLMEIPSVLIETIRSNDPQVTPQQRQACASLMGVYSAPVFANFFDTQYRMALAMPQSNEQEANDKGRVLDALQISELRAFGQARPLNLTPMNGTAVPNPGPDPERLALQQRLRDYEQRERQSQQQQVHQVRSGIETQAKTLAMAAIDAVLTQTNVKSRYSAPIIDSQKRDIYESVNPTLEASNPTGWRNYQIQLQEAVRGKIDAAVPVATYQKLFQNALKTSASTKQRLTELVGTAKATSDAQRTAAAQSQNRTEPSGTGAPVPQSVLSAGVITQQPGENRQDYIARRLASKMTQ